MNLRDVTNLTVSPNKLNTARHLTKSRYFQAQTHLYVTVTFQALMNISEYCSQTVEHSCHHILLSGFSSWLGRDGEWNSYWHGDRKSDEFGCECASNKTCQVNGI